MARGEDEEGGTGTSLDPPDRQNVYTTNEESRVAGQYLDENEIEAKIDQYAIEDKSSTKTLTRIFVEKYLQNSSWYFPGHANVGGPNLSKAYAFYEHFTLARHFTEAAAEHKLERAEPGEETPTELYSPFTTPEPQLIEFGIGVALYFSTLRVMAVILIVAGFISLPNLLYFSGSEYSDGQHDLQATTLAGTAICTLKDWVVCTDCTKDDYDGIPVPDTTTNAMLVLRNGCGRPGLTEGIVNYASLIFLMICFLLFGLYQRKREILFDESKQTATDYSVVVRNPPPDAYDCEKWRDFFSQFAAKEQVLAVTIALDNHMLLRKLINRRVLRNNLKALLPNDFDLDDEDLVREQVSRILKEREGDKRGFCSLLCGCTLLPILRLVNIGLSPDVLVNKIFDLTEEIKGLLNETYHVTKVFVTFETEAGQRTCLEALSASKLVIQMNQWESVSPSTVFEGRVLDVVEPVEPNTVRWLDLHVGKLRRIAQRIVTLGITVGVIGLAGYLVSLCRLNLGGAYAGPLTTAFNITIPVIVKLLLLIENHADEGSRQESLYLKVALFRWMNTAILIKIITPFTETVDGGSKSDLIVTIHSILWSELFLSPFLKLLDIVGNLKKHVIAPRTRTQEEMNLYFQGTPYNLGERYTDMTKVLFLCCFYSALFPSAFFFCGAILIVQYYTDKYCLMRIWASAPFLGPKLAVFSRRYFFSGALLAYVIVTAYDWAQFPFDNLCDAENTEGFNKTYTDVDFLNGTISDITVDQPGAVIQCNQHWRNKEGSSFPPTASRLQSGINYWMTDEQEIVANLFGWSSLALLVIFVVTFFGRSILKFFFGFCSKSYKAEGVDAQIDFQNVAEISLYVPQFKLGALNYPVIACDVDDVNTAWIGWHDPTHMSYDKHNLIFDVPHANMKRQRNKSIRASSGDGVEASYESWSPLFSKVKSWSREQQDKVEEEHGDDQFI